MAYRLLIAEDEKATRDIVSDYFTAKNFIVEKAANGVEALEILETCDFDVVLLDVLMPGLNGFEICGKIRKSNDVPIIFITAMVSEEDVLKGLSKGADDYTTKPFSLPVLFAKVTALIKRNTGDVLDDTINVAGIKINTVTRMVYVDDKRIDPSPKVYELLLYLIANKEKVLSRAQIIVRLWGYNYEGFDRSVDTHIKKLRAVLGDKACLIKTVQSVGYKFSESE